MKHLETRKGEDVLLAFAYEYYNSKNQQVKVKCQSGQIQENRYDAEGLRHEMKGNEKLLRFVYHRGELLYEGVEDEKSYHIGYGIEAVSGGGEISYHRGFTIQSIAFLIDFCRTNIEPHNIMVFDNPHDVHGESRLDLRIDIREIARVEKVVNGWYKYDLNFIIFIFKDGTELAMFCHKMDKVKRELLKRTGSL